MSPLRWVVNAGGTIRPEEKGNGMAYRVVQWASGAMGKTCLRALIDSPQCQLAGLFVYGADKDGRDAGEIARRPHQGIAATRNPDAILALDADVAIHCARLAPPYGSHDSEIIHLLASGKNVISINGYSCPQHWGGERLARLEAAARAGGSTLLAAGLNPGFVAEQLAVVATGVCARLDHVEVVETVDCRVIRSPDYAFTVLGFGADPAQVDPNDPAWGPASSLNGMYSEVLAAMAHHLGLTLERVTTEHQAFPATKVLEVGAGRIEAGMISHVHWRWRGWAGGEPRLAMSIHWTMEPAHLPEPDPPLWRVRISGSPGVNIAVQLDKPVDDTTLTSAEQLGLAGAVLNAIPLVVAAPPGVMIRPLATPFRFDRSRA